MHSFAYALLKRQFFAPTGLRVLSGHGTQLTTKSTMSFKSNSVIIDSDHVVQLFFLFSKVSSILDMPESPPFIISGAAAAVCDAIGADVF